MVHVLKAKEGGAQDAEKQPLTEGRRSDKAEQPVARTNTEDVEVTVQKAKLDPLDHFAAHGDHLAQVLWQIRHEYPNFTLKITQPDIQAFWDSNNYLKVEPKVTVTRPQGRPAVAAVPATATASARPAMDAEPPRDYVIIQLTDQAGNGIVPVENNEADYEKGQQARKREMAAQQVATLATGVRNAARGGEFSESDIVDLCEAALTLIR